MNIFATSSCPTDCANSLDDIRGNKLILENAQMLSTALRSRGCTHPSLYKPFNPKHPCNVWVYTTLENFQWLVEHSYALCSLKPTKHSSMKVIQLCEKLGPNYLPSLFLSKFANCAKNDSLGIDYTAYPVYEAYRKYLVCRWEHDTIKLTWKNRNKPSWS